ncbi:MAG TPA: Bcr/CflA family efflux MFS transporter [Leucothrix mucor]|nr:Bcr/CflA family efflux MFS transporter [Leucothrix mucor]
MVGPFSIDTYLPAFPSIEVDLGVSRALLSQTLAIYLASFALMTLVWGPVSDRFGRKPVLYLSTALYLLSSLACALAEDFESLMLFRALQGISASGGYVAGRAMIRDAFNQTEARQVMSQVMMLFALGPAIAPLVGSALHDIFGWRSIFYFLAFYGAVALLMVVMRLAESLKPEDQQSIHPQQVAKTYYREVTHLRFVLLVFIVTICFAGLFIYIAGAPTIIFDFMGWQTTDFVWLFIPVTIGIMLGAASAAKLAHLWSAEKIINNAFIILMIASVFNLVLIYMHYYSPMLIIGSIAVYSFALAWLMPNISILALDCFPKNRGSAAAVQGSIQMTSNALIAAIVAPMLAASFLHFATAQFVFVILALVLWYLLPSSTLN